MDNSFNLSQLYDKLILPNSEFKNKEFEDCIFKNCDFANSNFSSSTFIDCEFESCNLSMMQLQNVSLKNVTFKNCKLLGLFFNHCTDFLFQVEFQDCVLDFSSFANKKMPKTKFISCSMKETTFIGTDLNQAFFDNCNLDNAVFNETQLAGSNFVTSYNYKIDPEFNPMKKAKFSNNGIIGLLDKYDIIVK